MRRVQIQRKIIVKVLGYFELTQSKKQQTILNGPVILILIRESARPNNIPRIIERTATSKVNTADCSKSGRVLKTGLQWKL